MSSIPIGTRVEGQGPVPRRVGIVIGAPAGFSPAPDGFSWVRWYKTEDDQFDYLAHVEGNGDLTRLDDQIELWVEKVEAGLIGEIGSEDPPHATPMLAAVAFTDDDYNGVHFAVRESDTAQAELKALIDGANNSSGYPYDLYVIRQDARPAARAEAEPAYSLGIGLATVRMPQQPYVGVWEYDSTNGSGFCLGRFLGYETNPNKA